MKFRSEIRHATQEMLDAARREHGIDFRDLQTELYALAISSQERLTKEELVRWAHHPDEMVPIMLARLHGNEHDVCQYVAERALRDAEAEGVVWTPLLDALSDPIARARDLRYIDIDAFDQRHRELRSWVESVDDPDDLVPLAAFGSYAVRHYQLEKAKTIPEALIPHWIRTERDAYRVLSNRHILQRHAPAIMLHIFSLSFSGMRDFAEVLDTTLQSKFFAQTDEDYADRLIDRALGSKDRAFWTVAPALAVVIDRLPKIRTRRIEELLDTPVVLQDKRLQVSLVLHPSAPQNIDPLQLAAERQFFVELVSHPSASARLLRKAWQRFGFHVAPAIVGNSRVPDDLALEIIESWDNWKSDWSDCWPIIARPSVALRMLTLHERLPLARDILSNYAKRGRLDRMPYHRDVIAKALRIILQRSFITDTDLEAIEKLAAREALPLDPDIHAELLRSRDYRTRERLIMILGSLKRPNEQRSEQRPPRRSAR